MVLKSTSVLSCLLPARFAFGSAHKPDVREKHPVLAVAVDPDDDPFRCSRLRANTAPSALLCPNADIGESPNPALRSTSPPANLKRASLTTFFAFSSKKKPNGVPVIHLQRDLLSPSHSVPGRWLSAGAQTQVHVINHSSIPSPLRSDEDEYYYSYYTSHSLSPNPDTQPARQQDPTENPDLHPHLSSPVDTHQPHTHLQHPYAYSTPLCSRPHSKTTPSLRHAISQTFQHHPSDLSPTLVYSRATSSQVGHPTYQTQPHPSQPRLKTSISTPNLATDAVASRSRSLAKRRPSTRPKPQERWLSAETWWDAILSPSPRFKVRQVPRSHQLTGYDPVNKGEPSRSLGVSFPSVPTARPRAVSAVSNARPTLPTLARSRSTTDLGQASTSPVPRTGFEPALETLVDEPTLPPLQATNRGSEVLPLEPPLSLAQVIDEGQAFEEQRAQWKRQATKSIGNKRTRSFSRARSKSLSEKHDRGHGTPESARVHFNLEFLAARSLLGSQSTMPTVHIVRPSNASTHSKAYSNSHSTHSHAHTSHSRSYSHSHSHSLSHSNSSKSSRNPRGHSRSGSWGRTALLKAGALCGIAQDESFNDERLSPPSRLNVIDIGASSNVGRTAETPQVSPSPDVPTDEVGVAISSSPPLVDPPNPTLPNHPYASSALREQTDRESRWSSKPSYRSSGYAGPHPSAVDSHVTQLAGGSNASLRHRLPPHATIYPPISPIAHPYGTAVAPPGQVGNKPSKSAPHRVSDLVTEPSAQPTPHTSFSHPDFEKYGVGEALVYFSPPRPGGVPDAKQADVSGDSSAAKLSPPEGQSTSYETVASQREELDTASMAVNTPPSLTNSTIQMVMSAFNNPDDLDEFQDLFYKPRPVSGDFCQESPTTINQLPIDVHSSTSSSPLTHLVRKLSEEVHSRLDPSRTPPDPIYLQRGESHDHPLSESATKIVFMGLPRMSSSPPPMESSSQIHVQGTEESTLQPEMVVPEDVESSYTASVSPLQHENDTFGCPIKHGQLEAVTAPPPTRTSIRVSTHPSIQEAEVDESAAKRYGLSAPDAIRSSGVTTSDISQMSGIFDFPLPPSTRPGEEPVHASVLHSYFDATASEAESQSDGHSTNRAETEGDEGRNSEDSELSGDVRDTVHALRAARVASCDSRRTFGKSDADFMPCP